MLPIRSCPGRRTWRPASSARTAASTSPTELYPDVVSENPPGTAGAPRPGRTRHDLAADGALVAPPRRAAARGHLKVDGALTGLRLSRLREPRWHLWLADDERAPLRPLGRPGFANRSRWTPDHPVRRTSAWRRLAKRTVEDWVARHGWNCPGWHRPLHPVRPGELTADHPVPLVLGGEPLPARPGVLCSGCNARKGLRQRRR